LHIVKVKDRATNALSGIKEAATTDVHLDLKKDMKEVWRQPR
jgi:hypothetical protein